MQCICPLRQIDGATLGLSLFSDFRDFGLAFFASHRALVHFIKMSHSRAVSYKKTDDEEVGVGLNRSKNNELELHDHRLCERVVINVSDLTAFTVNHLSVAITLSSVSS